MRNKKSESTINPLYKFQFGLKHRIAMYEKLKSYTEEGFPVYESLVKFKKRFDKRKDFRAKIVEDWLKKMQNGQNFRQAIKGWVPDAELNLITAGEEGTGLDQGLQEAIRFAKSSTAIKKTIQKGLAYPGALFAVIIIFIAMFSIQLAPTYLEILPLEKWTAAPSFMYSLSSGVVNYWFHALIVCAIIGFIISKTIGIWTGSIRKIFDKIPPWSVYKVYQACAFLISLASMMQSGTPLNDALTKLKKTSSKWLATYIDQMLKNIVQGGKNFGEHLDVGLLDQETADDVIDYSELSSFEKAIYSIGEKTLTESIEQIDARMGLIKNIMLLLVGVCIGLIYFSSVELSASAAEATGTK